MDLKRDIVLIIEDVRSTHNVGSIFRTAEVFGVKEIFLCGYTPSPSHDNDERLPHIANKLTKQIHKTALGAEKLVNFRIFIDAITAIDIVKAMGYTVAALEQSKNSILLHNYEIPLKLAIVLGNEVDGVSDWTIKSCDVILEIEQYGQKESLNVASAASIAMYAVRSKI